jgi:1-acyl-sn-glycerol-3-phosphate acyltransferase
MTVATRLGRALAERLLPRAELERLARLKFADAGHGYDALGLHPGSIATAVALSRFFYERYFRVTSVGASHIPSNGAAILVANHSGMLPIDGALVVLDILRHTDPPRVARAIGDLFIPVLPVIGTAFARVGMVSGSRGNFRALIQAGELVLVFPEGVPGIGKGFSHRYELQDWRVGHAEFAIRHQVPIVPIAVIGLEEAWPQLTKIEWLHPFGAPHIPVPLLPLPLPLHVETHYGSVLHLADEYAPSDADDPELVSCAAERVKRAVGTLIARARAERGVAGRLRRA